MVGSWAGEDQGRLSKQYLETPEHKSCGKQIGVHPTSGTLGARSGFRVLLIEIAFGDPRRWYQHKLASRERPEWVGGDVGSPWSHWQAGPGRELRSWGRRQSKSHQTQRRQAGGVAYGPEREERGLTSVHCSWDLAARNTKGMNGVRGS